MPTLDVPLRSPDTGRVGRRRPAKTYKVPVGAMMELDVMGWETSMLDERQHTYEQMVETAARYMVDEPMCQTIILRTGPTRTVREANRELNSLTEGAVALGLLVSSILDPENKGAVMVILNGTAGQLGNLAGYMIKVKAGSGR